MPWQLIMSVGLQLINVFVKDLEKRSAMRSKFISYVRSRTGAQSSPIDAREAERKNKEDLLKEEDKKKESK